jgi:hypothetical protein
VRHNWCNGHNVGRHFLFHSRKLETAIPPLCENRVERICGSDLNCFIGLPHVGELAS